MTLNHTVGGNVALGVVQRDNGAVELRRVGVTIVQDGADGLAAIVEAALLLLNIQTHKTDFSIGSIVGSAQ